MHISATLFRISNSKKRLASLLLLGAGLLHADPIVYTFTGSGTGTLGSTAFTDANFVVTLTSDTANVESEPGLGSIPGIIGLPLQMSIDGIGPLSFNGTAFIYTTGTFNLGFGVSNPSLPSPPGNLIDIVNSNITGYGLVTNFTSSGINDAIYQFQNVSTNGGMLTFSSMSSVTFESELSSAVPEPGTLPLLGTGLFGLVWMRRRRMLSMRPPRRFCDGS